MTPLHKYALGMMIGNTNCSVDNKRNVLLLRAHAGQERQEVMRAILDARREWKTWLTLTQRQWQAKTRRQSRANHHDSVAIREKYVRCAA